MSTGNYSGTIQDLKRARQGATQREKQKKEYEQRKEAMEKEASKGLKSLSSQFQTQDSAPAMTFKETTVGLVSADEYKKRKLELVNAEEETQKRRKRALKKEEKRRKKMKKKMAQTLSFDVDEDGDADEDGAFASSSSEVKNRGPTMSNEQDTDTIEEKPKKKQKLKKFTKNPEVDTSFLPDRMRDEKEAELREELKRKWIEDQEKIKNQCVEITYSYWDGSGHRRVIEIEKGKRIDEFLEAVRLDMAPQFTEMRNVSVENLMYVKEDLIIPHNYTFYDLITSKARGKSGPLFVFDVHDDIRMLADASKEKDESHAGKVITRAWYDRNKHIFPASRWEVYDPSVSAADKYTVK